jgi:hypothetical protein
MTEPTLKEKVLSLLTEAAIWGGKGFPIADQELVQKRLEICSACPHWNSKGFGGTGKCTVCGCSTKAKLTMSTSKCPEAKW